MNRPSSDSTVSSDQMPNALLVWDNQARKSLSPGMLAWLSVLVVTCLCSVLFVSEHVPPRWVLAGFLMSHVIVWGLAATTQFTIRRGFVSLAHVLCWAPGWIAVMLDTLGSGVGSIYSLWSIALIVVISISFLFDLRDAGAYLYYLAKGKIPE